MLSSLRAADARMGTRYTSLGQTGVAPIISSAGSAGATLGTAAIAGTSLVTAGITAGVGLAVTGVMMWLNDISASHQADTITTAIVNQLAVKLQDNLNAFMSGPRTCADQQAALAAYDAAWQWLTGPQACSNPSDAVQHGGAGQRCISDRAPGGRWPWQTYYRDPIASTPPSDMTQGQCSMLENSVGQANAIASLANLTGNSGLLQEAQATLLGASGSESGSVSSLVSSLPPLVVVGAVALLAYVVLK